MATIISTVVIPHFSMRLVNRLKSQGSALNSDALLTCWHQALDLRQKVTTENANAILVG
jgi:hypothetical protein